MQSKLVKSQASPGKQLKSIRISSLTQKKLEKILCAANKKKFGRKIKAEHVLALALDLVAERDILLLQENSLSNEDRTEQLRQLYISKHGPTTRDSWLGFMMTSDFHKFLQEHSGDANGSTPQVHPVSNAS
jgi:hypothetical protein